MSSAVVGFFFVVVGLSLASSGSAVVLGSALLLLGLFNLVHHAELEVQEQQRPHAALPTPIYITKTVYVPEKVSPKPVPVPLAQSGTADRRAIERAFRRIDINGNDEIDFYELKTALGDLGFYPITNDLVQRMMSEADVEFEDGKIDFREFCKICERAFCSSDWAHVRNKIRIGTF